MSEDSQPDDESYLVRVKAVVMMRDDSSGGWLVQEGGGLSRVGVCKVVPADLELIGRSGFLIYGERLRDKQVILKCFLKKDLVYTKATPTFHHWRVDNKKCGLTFQSPSDARAFDRGVRKAIEDLTDGSTTSSSTLQNEAELGDDDVFTTATDSSSNSSQKREPPVQSLPPISLCDSHRHPHCILGHFYQQHRHTDHHFLEQTVPMFPRQVSFPQEECEEEIVRINPRERNWLTGYEDYRHATATSTSRASDPAEAYISFTKKEQSYPNSYPNLYPNSYPYHNSYPYPNSYPDPSSGNGKSLSGPVLTQPVCVYCRDPFDPELNRRGVCPEAPDPADACIRRASCMWCADSLLYHCMSDPEGDYSDPCSCEPSEEHFCLRWAALLGLSLVFPCMCCYGPLRALQHCARACHCCGGRHKATG